MKVFGRKFCLHWIRHRQGANLQLFKSPVTTYPGVLGWAPQEEDSEASSCVPEGYFTVSPTIMGRQVRQERGGCQTEYIHEQVALWAADA